MKADQVIFLNQDYFNLAFFQYLSIPLKQRKVRDKLQSTLKKITKPITLIGLFTIPSLPLVSIQTAVVLFSDNFIEQFATIDEHVTVLDYVQLCVYFLLYQVRSSHVNIDVDLAALCLFIMVTIWVYFIRLCLRKVIISVVFTYSI